MKRGVYGKSLVESVNMFKEKFGVDNDYKEEYVVMSRSHALAFILGKVKLSDNEVPKIAHYKFSSAKFIISGRVDFRKLRGKFKYKVSDKLFDSTLVHDSIRCLCLNNVKEIDVWLLNDDVLALGNLNGFIIIAPIFEYDKNIYGIESMFLTTRDDPIFYDDCEDCMINPVSNVSIDRKLIELWIAELGL